MVELLDGTHMSGYVRIVLTSVARAVTDGNVEGCEGFQGMEDSPQHVTWVAHIASMKGLLLGAICTDGSSHIPYTICGD